MKESPDFVFDPLAYPTTPGVYLMKDGRERIIYVGKAKVLRNRLRSYFRQEKTMPLKVRSMMPRVKKIEVLCTGTEKEALLLEASLIKKHKPHYNIILKDDKQFILFRLNKNADFPRLTKTRKVIQDGSVYFGPFTSAQAATQTLLLINKIFPLRKCTDKAMKNRVRPCLQYDIGRCLAPCVKEVDAHQYAALVRQAEMFLSGKCHDLLQELKKRMQLLSSQMEYEKAASVRDQIQAIETTIEQQAVVLDTDKEMDIIGPTPLQGGLALAVLFIRQGKLIDSKRYFWADCLENEWESQEFLTTFLVQFYSRYSYVPQHIVLPYDIEQKEALLDVLADLRQGPVRVGKARGQSEKKLLDMAVINASESGTEDKTKHLFLPALASALQIGAIRRIECIDASHLSGEGMRVGMVVYEDGQPVPDAYRIYSFPELEGSHDDYLALRSFLKKRLEKDGWPDLLLIDGGRGQLSALELELRKNKAEDAFALASIAKGKTRRAGELEDRIFIPGRKNPLPLRPGSPELLFLQQVRDSAHRYVLGSQRKSRKKKLLDSALESLPGIGTKTAALLWQHFVSVEAMKKASLEDLQALPNIGKQKARQLQEALKGIERRG